jgi:phosphopentomutase
MKAVLIILDSVGIGEAPDAALYGDTGASTLAHAAAAVGSLQLPTLTSLGLGNIPAIAGSAPIAGVNSVARPLASYGAMREVSEGKDTITGHWELAGLEMNPGFSVFPSEPPSFPEPLIEPFVRRTGRRVIGNKACSGTVILDELGPEHMQSGDWIVYTSADSVFQLAAHLDQVPLDELYAACAIARELCDPYRIGRVIARPFTGAPGTFVRTEERKDFCYQPPEPTILERLTDHGVPVYAVGKIDDIYAHRGIMESRHTGNNPDSQAATAAFYESARDGLVIANFVDFDMLYGHRRDPKGYAGALEQTDGFLSEFVPAIASGDLLIITADHGNDPTFHGTDHTRELVPLLVYEPGAPGRNLGLRTGFDSVAQSLAAYFSLPSLTRGVSFL